MTVTITSGDEGQTLHIYDNFGVGLVAPGPEADEDARQFVNLLFTEQDRGVSHIFKLHKDQVEQYVNMVREAAGAKVSVHSAVELAKLKEVM